MQIIIGSHENPVFFYISMSLGRFCRVTTEHICGREITFRWVRPCVHVHQFTSVTSDPDPMLCEASEPSLETTSEASQPDLWIW